MAHITVAGVGPGSEKYLTRACIEAAEQADILVGGRRQLALFSHLTSEKYVITAAMDKLIDYLADNARAGKKLSYWPLGTQAFTVYSLLYRTACPVSPSMYCRGSLQYSWPAPGWVCPGTTFF